MSNPPPRLGAYSLERELGQGGMGSVWLARHAENGGLCALKLIPASSDPELVERFRREGEAMARVSPHPNLTRVHALLEGEGWLGLVLEYCPGGDLGSRLRQGPLEPEAARALASGLASGLEVAHAAGILHRDLKPANVVFDDSHRPKLTDFGLAKLHDRQSLTQSGALLGTPSYMAPEQATTGDCDVRTDVYGLGGILYHCLSGRPPFTGSTVLGILDQVLRAAPAPLPATVPPEMARACLRALAKDPAERFPDAASFRAALNAEVGAPGPSRSLLGGAAIFALVLLGGALVHASLRPAPQPGPTAATPAPSPSATPAPTPQGPRVVPGLLPWPSRPPESLDSRSSLLFLQELARRKTLALPAVFARHLQWRIQNPTRLSNIADSQPTLLRPSVHLRGFERGGLSLVGLIPHLQGAYPKDGFRKNLVDYELFLLLLLRNGDPLGRAQLARLYEGSEHKRLAFSLHKSSSDVSAWRTLGQRAEQLLDAPTESLRRDFPEIHPGRVRGFLSSSWGELAPLSAYTLQLGLTLPPPTESLEDAQLGAATASMLEGGDARVFVIGVSAGSFPAARALSKHLLERDSKRERRIGQALLAITYLAGNEVQRKTMLAQGELGAAGFHSPKEPLVDQLDGIRARITTALIDVGLLGAPPKGFGPDPLPAAPPRLRAGLDVRALLADFLPEAPILQCLWREALLTRSAAQRSKQAQQLTDAIGSKGLSALKHLIKSLGSPSSHYYDPVLATRLALRMVRGGQSGTAMILYGLIERHGFQPQPSLLSSCLGLSKKFDKLPLADGVAGTTKPGLTVPRVQEAWPPLLTLDVELSRRPFRKASDRVGPPPRVSVEAMVLATAPTFPLLRWLRRSSQRLYDNDQSREKLLKRATNKAPPRTRILMAAFRRGAWRAFPELLQENERVQGSPLLRAALIQFLLSAEDGPIEQRESWKLAVEHLPKLGFGKLSRLLYDLMQQPRRADLWRAFYRERERVFFRLGLPALPELAAWGTPWEVLGQ